MDPVTTSTTWAGAVSFSRTVIDHGVPAGITVLVAVLALALGGAAVAWAYLAMQRA